MCERKSEFLDFLSKYFDITDKVSTIFYLLCLNYLNILIICRIQINSRFWKLLQTQKMLTNINQNHR